METIKIKISKDFSPTPGPRYIKEGPFSGEDFREKILYPTIKKVINEKGKLIVDLDGTAGYGTSFLEESFGGLIRVKSLNYSDVITVLDIKSNEEEFLKEDIQLYLDDAKKEPNN
jgi:STAS-like domain of unknown function (DUF4325)